MMNAQNSELHKPEYHDAGWHLSIHDYANVVGLWSSCLKNRFFLGYPKDKDVPDKTIMKTLDVSRSWISEWGKFYGPKLPGEKGRVWINKSKGDMYEMYFPMVDGKGKLRSVYYGHNMSAGISTYPFDRSREYEPDAPSINKEAIQAYREKFLQLAVETALSVTNPTAIAIKYDTFALALEDLKKEGYSDIEWITGIPDHILGWEMIRAEKENETIFLSNENAS
ncbi:MAG: hypothetical protein V1836_00585, partial [Candidatus Aenigmatarchaeota archaeon]